VAERPVSSCDLLATMYDLLGIDPDGPLPNSAGVTAKVMPDAKRLTELV